MGFGGSALAMAQTLRNNAKQLAKRNNYFEKDVPSKFGTSTKIVDYKKMSPAQFEAFKQKLRQKEIERQKRLTIVFGSVMVVIIAALVYLLFFY
ncbi:hypothetical protein LS48_05850 [Aequorivita aquimaris]|uniref:Uncharacterized protein n=1 Tax=Aequorivita aquimaris TaxID=1548749 RepID=A0A137RIJ0_9FLAO|nr:hypothetical protein [Aequorivita aquimaris]KXO00001.1 hypothetical protein LS48_05850 [Aequorivita aquimaris]|tara:strand:- start:61 stop:342 length:282 start_codon:yes stop_codon:yes gene_type:complete